MRRGGTCRDVSTPVTPSRQFTAVTLWDSAGSEQLKADTELVVGGGSVRGAVPGHGPATLSSLEDHDTEVAPFAALTGAAASRPANQVPP